MAQVDPINVAGSGITITDCGFSNWTAVDGMTVVSQAGLDIVGADGVTINSIGGDPAGVSILADGLFIVRAGGASGVQGTLEYTGGAWKIDGKTLSEIVKEELRKLLDC